jgi:hypothetical protein
MAVMKRRNKAGCRFMMVLLLGLSVTGYLCRAQQPNPQQPAPAPSDPHPSGAQNDGDKKGTDKSEGTVGKSKLEKETGTVNDRIFEVIPNYGTVKNANTLPPLSSGQKFRLATAGVFDWGSYPFNGALSAIAQARNDPKEWGQGWGAYGKRFGRISRTIAWAGT